MFRYIPLAECNAGELMGVLNNAAVRTHLIEHPSFDMAKLARWIDGKIKIDQQPGCRIRGILLDGEIAGWCGIQEEDGRYDMGIILKPSSWGIGPKIFRDMIKWAADLGHREIFIYLLDSRRAARPLLKLGFKDKGLVQMLGRSFRVDGLSLINWAHL